MTKLYQVVAECAFATIVSVTGKSGQLLLKGAPVPADAPELERLLRDGYVAEVTKPEDVGGVNADGIPAAAFATDVPAAITTTPVAVVEETQKTVAKAQADTELAARRAEAAAKLPEDGSAPKGTAGHDVFVEYLAKHGFDFAELTKTDKAELVKMAKTVNA